MEEEVKVCSYKQYIIHSSDGTDKLSPHEI
jgi:hypothetical protein